MRLNRLLLVMILATCCVTAAKSQKINLNTNMLYDATATINLGVEFKLGEKTSLQIPFNYNPWEFGDTYWKHFMVQPEFRFWFCRIFNGSFIGVHAHYAKYNVGNIDFIDNLKDHRYQGDLYGAGISYGYQWILGNRLNLEATIGAGYARLSDKKYPTGCCGDLIRSKDRNYWGITKVGVTLVYFIK